MAMVKTVRITKKNNQSPLTGDFGYMPHIGAHVSIAGGIIMAPARAAGLGCETFQCFTRSPQGGPAPVITESQVSNFKSQMSELGMETFYIHAPYYINLASLEPRIRHSSIKVLREELERGSVLGARYVMTHLGSYAGQTVEEGIAKVADAVSQILDGYKGTTEFLMEIAAGSGNIIGDTFDELGEILKQLGLPVGAGLVPLETARPQDPLGAQARARSLTGFGGICFDTCHAFASGYDFRTPELARRMLEEFDKKIGLKYLKLTHVNDSKFDLGGKKDRHEHIGDGFIGEAGIAAILNTPEFRRIDWLLETEDSKRVEDIAVLKKLRSDNAK